MANLLADMVLGMLSQGIFSVSEIKDKNVLVIGGLQDYVIADEACKFFSRKGAKTTSLLVPFYQNRGDGKDNLADAVQGKIYDCVLLMEGLEKTQDFISAAASVADAVAPGGHLLITARTPYERGTALEMYYYEDTWRYTSEDIRTLFTGYALEREATTEPAYFTAVKLKRITREKLKPQEIMPFNCHVGRRATLEESRSFGFFYELTELSDMGDRLQTDKCSLSHNYLDKYEFFLRPFRDKEFNLLELGVFTGASEELWRDYFPKAHITGVDIDPDCRQYAGERIDIRIMDLAKQDNLEKLKEIQPLIIIDDASHIWSHQIKALFTLFDVLPSGGVYILEDMETSLNAEKFTGYDDAPQDAYTVCERIARVAASKAPDKGELWGSEITAIGMQTELVATMKGSCIFIKR